jgi:O-succinylbenzoic acid--CoA ligase
VNLITSAAGLQVPALTAEQRSWTYGELSVASDELAAEIKSSAKTLTRPVAHVFGLEAAGALAVHAIATSGLPLVLGHPSWTPAERDVFIDAVNPSLILSPAGWDWVSDGWSERRITLPNFDPVSLWSRTIDTSSRDSTLALSDGTDVAIWTSGSGGKPKLVCHSWSALTRNADEANKRLCFGTGHTWLATLAWSHIGGLGVLLRTARVGSTLAFGPSRFEAKGVLEAIEKWAASHVSLVPAMLQAMLDIEPSPPQSLEVVLIGGAATSPSLTERALSSGWPIALTYGMTEAGSQVSVAPPAEVARGNGSVGPPLSCIDVRIASPEAASAAGLAHGEIELSGSTLFLGYGGDTLRDPLSWFSTGDLGYLDDSGCLRVTGRRSDQIITGGVNVDPDEVEDALLHHPDVVEACVLGIPDDTWGEVVTAVIVGDGRDLVRRVDTWIRDQLSSPKTPRRLFIVEELPRTVNGKVDRTRVRSRIMAATKDRI